MKKLHFLEFQSGTFLYFGVEIKNNYTTEQVNITLNFSYLLNIIIINILVLNELDFSKKQKNISAFFSLFFEKPFWYIYNFFFFKNKVGILPSIVSEWLNEVDKLCSIIWIWVCAWVEIFFQLFGFRFPALERIFKMRLKFSSRFFKDVLDNNWTCNTRRKSN